MIFTGRLSALRHPGYLRYWFASFASVGGTNLQIMGQGWLVFELSESALMLGYLGAAASIPTIVLTLFGGALADRFNKRHILMSTSMITVVLLTILAVLDATGLVQVWHVITIATLISVISGLDWPTRQTVFPQLIEREDMMSAVALNSIIWQSCRMIMPAFGGLLIALTDTWLIFLLSAGGFLVMFFVISGLKISTAPVHHLKNTLQQIGEGLSFIYNTRLFLVLISLTYASMFFGNAYMQLMPAFSSLLGASETGYGILLSTTGVGSVLGTILVGSMQHSMHLGRIMLASAATAAFSLFGFAAATAMSDALPFAYLLALVSVFFTSLFHSIYMIASMTVLQLNVPDALRGRVMGLHGITYSLMPLGGLFAGALATISSEPVAISIGAAVLLTIIILIATSQKSLRQLDGRNISGTTDGNDA